MLIHVHKINVFDILNFMNEVKYEFKYDDFTLTIFKLTETINNYYTKLMKKHKNKTIVEKHDKNSSFVLNNSVCHTC